MFEIEKHSWFIKAHKLKDIASVGLFYYGLYWIPLATFLLLFYWVHKYVAGIADFLRIYGYLELFVFLSLMCFFGSVILYAYIYYRWIKRNRSEVLNLDVAGLRRIVEYEVLPEQKYRYKRQTTIRAKRNSVRTYVDRMRWSGTRCYEVINYSGGEEFKIMKEHRFYDFVIFTFMPFLQKNDERTLGFELLIHDEEGKASPILVIDNKRIRAAKNEIYIYYPSVYIGHKVSFTRHWDTTTGMRKGGTLEYTIERDPSGKGILYVPEIGGERLR